ncbi:unnamed protein product [Dicrocoelium dendriticum]|nr:unnamed protein product [Dicrocoelium dendriticum]
MLQDTIAIILISYFTAFLGEGLTWLFVYRTERYQKLKSEVDKQSKRLEEQRDVTGITIDRTAKKRLEKQEERLKNISREFSMVKMKSMFALLFANAKLSRLSPSTNSAYISDTISSRADRTSVVDFIDFVSQASPTSCTKANLKAWRKDAFKALRLVNAERMFQSPEHIVRSDRPSFTEKSTKADTLVSEEISVKTPRKRLRNSSNAAGTAHAPLLSFKASSICSLRTPTLCLSDISDTTPISLLICASRLALCAYQWPSILWKNHSVRGRFWGVKMISMSVGTIPANLKAWTDVFEQAKNSAPCVLHLDDIESMERHSVPAGTFRITCLLKSQLLRDLIGSGVAVVGETRSLLASLPQAIVDLFSQRLTFGMLREEHRLNHKPILITRDLVDECLAIVVPAVKNTAEFVTIPNITWADVGGLDSIRTKLHNRFMLLVDDWERAQALHRHSGGVLLEGPPGCGKTLVAKALSNQAGLNFLSVKGPEVLNKFQGESERRIREIFERARACQPCLIFFDEIDAICPRRDGDEATGSRVSLVNQLLVELDGIDKHRSGRVFVVGATNRKDMIDPAILRPGRLGLHLFINPPQTAAERASVLCACTQSATAPIVQGGVESLNELANDSRTIGMSGADLDNLLEVAKQLAQLDKQDFISRSHLYTALKELCTEKCAQ